MDAFPHLNINVKDESIFTPIATENLPLHRPIYVMKTEKGPVNKPVWCPNMATAEAVFGKKTFDQYNPDYFSRSSVFLNYSFPYNGAFIVRIDSDTMEAAAVILTVTIPSTIEGEYAYNLITVDPTDGGYWNDEGQWNDSFQWNSHSGYAANVFPLAIVNMEDPGLYGNSYGFQLFSDRSKANNIDLENMNNHLYSFAFVKQDEGYDTVSRIQTRYPVYQFEFVSEQDKQDPVTKLYMDYDAAEDRYFGNDYPAPAKVHMFSDNWKVLTDDVITKYFNSMSTAVKTALGADTIEQAYLNSRRINITNMTILNGENVELPIGGTTTTTFSAVTNSGPSTTIDSVADVGGLATFTLDNATGIAVNDEMVVTSATEPSYNTTHVVTAVVGNVVSTASTYVADSTGNAEVYSNAVVEVADATNFDVADPITISGNSVPAYAGDHVITGATGNAITIATLYAGVTDSGDAETVESAKIDMTGTQLNASTDQMLSEGRMGSDGTLNLSGAKLDNNNIIESRIQRFFTLQSLPEVVDKAHYPFNTIVDTGYGMDLKGYIADFLSIRDDVSIVMSSWAGSGNVDQATTVAVAKTLINDIRQAPESELFGTGTFRANLFGQVGKLNSTIWKEDMPLTLWYTTKLAEYHNLTYIKEQPAGLPNSSVEMFKSISWSPASKTTKRDLWENCVNYAQHYDMTHIHFPGIKSVYKHDTSVLSTDSYKNTVVYIKQLSLPIWAKYAGVEDVNVDAIYNQVLSDLDAKLAHTLHDRYQFQTRMYQTEEEANYGYIHHLEIILVGGPSQRVWNLDIICRRPNFGPTQG